LRATDIIKKFHGLLGDANFHLDVEKRPPLVLSHINLVHWLIINFVKIYFNTIFPLTPERNAIIIRKSYENSV
jgi:hypothetical protein